MSRFRVCIASSSLVVVLLSGCGVGTTVSTVGPEGSAATSGKVFGGQQPVKNSLVTVWAAGTVDYGSPATALASTHSLSDGTFSFPANSYTCTDPSEAVYITAAGGDPGTGVNNPDLMLVAGLGPCATAPDAVVNIDEVTTAVTAFALGNFFTKTLGIASTDSFGSPAADSVYLKLSNASTIPTLVNLPQGTVNDSTTAIKIEAPKIYTIANVIAACVNSDPATSTACSTLFANTTPPTTTAVTPTDTLQAAVQMGRYPYQNVSALYTLSTAEPPFLGLPSAPNDWTIGVSYRTTGLGLGINGTSTSRTSNSIDIDTSGRVWLTSNMPSSPGLAYFDPSTNMFSPAFNAPSGSPAVSHPQYVAIDPSGVVWATDEFSTNILEVLASNPMETFGATAVAGGKSSGPLSIDTDGNVYFGYIESGGTPNLGEIESSSGTVLTAMGITNPANGLVVSDIGTGGALEAATSGSSTPCYLESYGSTGDVVTAQTSGNCVSGTVANTAQAVDAISVASTANELCSYALATCFAPDVPLSKPEGIATDGTGNVWVANAGNGSISTLLGPIPGVPSGPAYTETSPVAYLHNSANGGTMTAPFGLAIDGSGNVWVANASCITSSGTLCTPTSLTLSELIGAAGPTITPLSNQDDGDLTGTVPGSIPPAVGGVPVRNSGSSAQPVKPLMKPEQGTGTVVRLH